jgi:hypothetical protein
MPFGKYRGWRLAALPDDYVEWLLSLEDLRAPLAARVLEEATRRGLHRHHHHDQDRSAQPDRARRYVPDVIIVEKLVGAGLRTLARKYHPDAGGDHELMVAANHAADWLIDQVRSLSV